MDSSFLSSDSEEKSSSDQEFVVSRRQTRNSVKKKRGAGAQQTTTSRNEKKKSPPARARRATKRGRQTCWKSTKKRNIGRPKGGKQVLHSWEGFSFASSYYEDHQKPLYGIAFSPFVGLTEEEDPIFATVGSNRATIYKCPRDTVDIELLQCYQDDELEEYFCCTWLYDTRDEYHLLAVGDRRVKIWHVTTSQCLLMVGGASPHTDEVLTADFDVCGGRVVTGSMDHFIKVWDIKAKLEKQMEEIGKIRENHGKFLPAEVNFPQVVTNEIHTNYIDCARFFLGDFLITKSCEEQICVWKIGDEGAMQVCYHHTRPETNISIFRTLPLPNSDVWFVKLVVDPTYSFLASGDVTGKIKLWPVGNEFMSADEDKPKVLQHRLMRRCVRQIDFSPKGEFLVGVCDDATVWRWDRKVEV